MIVLQQLFHRTYHDVLVEQHGDAITNRIEAVQIVRHHENGEAEAVVQSLDEFVVVGGADRVEAGGRLVQEQQLGVEGQRPGQAGALAHAAGELGRLLVAGIRRQADQGNLEGGDLAHGLFVQPGMLADRHDDVLRHRQRGKQGAVLELHAGAALDVAFGLAVQLADVLAEDLDGPLGRVVEADDGAQQHGFAGPRSAHKPDNLAAKYVEIEVVVDDVVAELRAHAAQLEHDVATVPVIDQLPAFRLLRPSGFGLRLRRLVRLPSSAIRRSPAGR